MLRSSSIAASTKRAGARAILLNRGRLLSQPAKARCERADGLTLYLAARRVEDATWLTRMMRSDSNRHRRVRNSRSDLACDIAVSYNVRMKTYRIVEFRRDGLVGWTVESSAPDAKRQPRLLYTTSDRAQAEADRLTAIEAAAGDPAATAKLAS